ncbi:BHLH domain-containing protein [Caerostris extrusa]|uniref:BHLH domain-containing protein n=1 Tax=Caerostris extrusa TaxID=172846 RepID=A0AAV4UPE6_CAEEX|nr:BHLH domain-containing protein [Caerostris extrusa]
MSPVMTKIQHSNYSEFVNDLRVFGKGEESNLRTRLVVRKNRGGIVTWEVGVAKDQHETWWNYVIGISVFVVVGSPSETWTRTRNIPKDLLRGEGLYVLRFLRLARKFVCALRTSGISIMMMFRLIIEGVKATDREKEKSQNQQIFISACRNGSKTEQSTREKSSYDDYENSFQEGYRLCLAEIQNFFKKSSDKKTSEELLMKPLLKYLCKRLKAPSANSEETLSDVQLNLITSLNSAKVPISAHQGFTEQKSDYGERIIPVHNNVSVLPASYKSQCPSVDSCSSTSLQSIEDEGNFSISEESESSSSEEKVFYGPENYERNETFNKRCV